MVENCENEKHLDIIRNKHHFLPRSAVSPLKDVSGTLQSFGFSSPLFRTEMTLGWAGMFRDARMLCCKWLNFRRWFLQWLV